MGRAALQPPRAVADALTEWGDAIRTARLRRNWRVADLAAKAGISDSTVQAVERGVPGAGAGAYVSAMWALGLLSLLDSALDPSADAAGVLVEAQRRRTRARPATDLDDNF
jgi:transcriptional regulator with XRE-family HTH domain